jgi:hypothetical protein
MFLNTFDVFFLLQMKEHSALSVSESLSALMQRRPKRPEGPPPPPPSHSLFSLPQLPTVESGEPTICVHCFLTDTSHPDFSHNSRSVLKTTNGPPTGTKLKTKFTFKTVTTEQLPIISRNLDRGIVGFLSGIPLIFVSVSHKRKSLSEIARFIFEINRQSEGGQQRDFEIKFPGTASAPLLAEESFEREFTQIRLKTPPFPTLYILNLFEDLPIRQFSEVLNQVRAKISLESENPNLRHLFPHFQRKIQIIIFVFTAINDEFLLSAFAEKKKSVVEQPHREPDFHVDPSGFFTKSGIDPTQLLIERASDHVQALKKYVEGQMAGLRREVSSAAVFRLLADLEASDHQNSETRGQIAVLAKEIETLEGEIAAIRARQQLREEVERERLEVSQLRAIVQQVFVRTEELRGRYEAVVGEMRAEIQTYSEMLTGEDRKERTEIPEEDDRVIGEIDAAQKKARKKRKRKGWENDSSTTNTPIVDKCAVITKP